MITPSGQIDMIRAANRERLRGRRYREAESTENRGNPPTACGGKQMSLEGKFYPLLIIIAIGVLIGYSNQPSL